jgi:hypothetical protein
MNIRFTELEQKLKIILLKSEINKLSKVENRGKSTERIATQ